MTVFMGIVPTTRMTCRPIALAVLLNLFKPLLTATALLAFIAPKILRKSHTQQYSLIVHSTKIVMSAFHKCLNNINEFFSSYLLSFKHKN